MTINDHLPGGPRRHLVWAPHILPGKTQSAFYIETASGGPAETQTSSAIATVVFSFLPKLIAQDLEQRTLPYT